MARREAPKTKAAIETTPSDENRVHTVITGGFRALEPAFLAEVSRLREADPLRPIVVLVTSHLLGLHLQRYLPERGLNHINLRFFTIEDLAEEVVWPELIATGKTRTPAFAPAEVVRLVCSDIKAGHKDFYFEAIADRRGFHKAILSTISDLKNAGLCPDDLKQVLADKPGGARAGKKSGAKAAKSATAAAGDLHKGKIADVLRIWQGYEGALADRDWIDDNDVLSLAAGAIPGARPVKEALAVLVYGFYDFTELEKRIINACSESRDTMLFVPYRPEPAFEYARPTIEWLEKEGFQVESADETVPESRPPALTHLTQHLFSDGAAAGEENQAISIISAPGELREVREIARRITQEGLRKESGLWDCGILPRAPDAYTAIIRETTRGLGLKSYMPNGMPLSGTHAGRSLILLLDILRNDYGRRSVMEFATFARLGAPFDEDTPANQPACWDVISMEAGIVGGEEEWIERLSTLLTDVGREYDDSEAGWRRTVPGGVPSVEALIRFVNALRKVLTPVAEADNWQGKVEAAESALRALVEDDMEKGFAAQDTGSSADDEGEPARQIRWTEEVLNAVRALADLDELIDPEVPESHPGVEEFYDAVEEALDSTAKNLGRFQRNGPAVIPLMRARGIPFRIVVLPGMVEKEFPPLVRPDAILLDHEREALNRALTGSEAGPIPLKSRRRLEEEKLLFRLAVGAATERLILTYPRLEMVTARERLPSSFLLATVEALTGERADFAALERFRGHERIPLSRIASEEPGDALDEVEFYLSRALGDLKVGKPRSILHMRDASPTLARALKLEAERWGKRVFTCYDGFLCNKEARKELKECYSIIDKEVSPTRLETYATCPYQYLLGNIMNLESFIEPERAHELSALDRGAIVHDILYKFLTELAGEGGGEEKDGSAGKDGAVRGEHDTAARGKGKVGSKGPDRSAGQGVIIKEKDRRLLHGIARREFQDFAAHGLTGFPALWTLEQERMLEWLDAFFDEELESGEWRPTYFEVRYGMKPRGPLESHISTDEPVPLPFGRRKVLLRGKIDRVDISDDGKRARVVDYKTGKARHKANDLAGGTSLQLPLYLHAVARLLQAYHKGIVPYHAEYYHLKEKTKAKRHIRFDGGALSTKRAELENILSTISDYVEAGYFFAVPGNQCEFCDFLSICGATRDTVFDLKSDDPAIKKYLEMTGELEEEAEEEDEREARKGAKKGAKKGAREEAA